MIQAAYSLRRRLLGWLLISTAIIGCVALTDTWREAVNTANVVSDRVLSGSALAIAERVVVAEDGSLEVDIPYVALEMLTSAAQDRVFYRVDGPNGQFLTCLLYTSRAHETPEHLVCRLLPPPRVRQWPAPNLRAPGRRRHWRY